MIPEKREASWSAPVLWRFARRQYARKNIAPLVLGEVWAARQRPPYLGVKLHPGNKNGAGF
jgi:hypothetical protein